MKKILIIAAAVLLAACSSGPGTIAGTEHTLSDELTLLGVDAQLSATISFSYDKSVDSAFIFEVYSDENTKDSFTVETVSGAVSINGRSLSSDESIGYTWSGDGSDVVFRAGNTVIATLGNVPEGALIRGVVRQSGDKALPESLTCSWTPSLTWEEDPV